MTSSSVTAIHSRDNAFVKDLRRLAQDTTAYRKQGRVWLEGDHLCRAALARGLRASVAVFSESFWPQAQVEYARAATKFIVLADALFADVSGLESPAAMGFILDLPAPASLRPDAATVVLDRVQDAGNVGSILRSASAFGFRQVAAIKGSAALWSPKVLRAGMGAHFALDLIEGLALDDLAALQVPLLVTSSHAGDFLHRAALPWPCAWVMGHEGQGVSPALEDRASLRIRIAQPGGEESLNVAAAAAICLHASGAGR
ncbi:TrmH family RNA methyltransferase [Acidovorax delafieldii]|jgi:TrmH family RNA methyltransferase|uniref:TrmH family RNA methyltransferase n=1 Tax=Acidovorax delafieldii TaxID=47920 RepID=A0AAJ2BZS0_ACIDE|nr:RNA methyltransferase [Acidovorax delafieldii]MDR6768898.1 TrmH family RNA methyltransferase [Acidovorax delafieldii]MDR6839275.1 TrmH family RNA methyltransferase [Acidovorax delafieldii]MDR7368826.1 TrmH family RNA methyltransferase [Acidovorax delafieldii]